MRRMIRFMTLLVVTSVIIVTHCVPALAITQGALDSINNNTPFFDPNACGANSDSSSSAASATSGASNGPIWNSGVQPPYYLESFIINVLEDVASKVKAPATNAVTQQHVLALVAWAYAEGGNIANTSGIFNPWNTGLDRPDLLIGGHSASGVQGFKSFDAGVEASAITMTAPNQSRIGSVLTNPTSSASDVLSAIANYPNYPGNQEWAGAPIPTYLSSLMANLQQAQSNYAKEASVELGPGVEGNAYVPVSQLKFTGTSGSASPTGGAPGSGSGGSCCGSGSAPPGGAAPTGGSADLGPNAGPAFIYLTQKGFSPTAAAAMVGNWQQESGVNPADAGGDLAQWGGSRFTAMQAFVAGENMPITSLNGQIDFVIHELNTGYTKALGELKADTDIATAVTDFQNDYEMPDKSKANTTGRIHYATEVLADFGGQAGAAGANSASCPGSGGSTNGCINPITDPAWGLARTDQGVDYIPNKPLPVMAICDGTIREVSGSGWPGGYFIYYKLTSGPFIGKCIYTAEHLTNALPVGTQVKAGQTIATALPGYPWTEWGWAAGDQTPSSRDGGGGSNGAGGMAFARFLRSLGAKTLTDPGPGPMYVGDTCT